MRKPWEHSKIKAMWNTKSGITVHQLLGGRSNVFLVNTNTSSLLVDSSWKFSRPRLRSALDKSIVQQARNLTVLFLTHCHFDHAQNAAWIQEKYHPKLIVHQSEAANLRQGENPKTAGSKLIGRVIYYLLRKLSKYFFRIPPVNPDITFNDQLDLTNMGFDAYILHTPGHSIGSSSLIVADEIAMVGDALFGVFVNSAYPPFVEDHDLLMASWKKLLETGCRVFLPSHGNAVSRDLLERDYQKRCTEGSGRDRPL